MGLGTMMVLHAAESAEGSQPILPGVNAGGFYALLNMARQVIGSAHDGESVRFRFERKREREGRVAPVGEPR